MGTGFNRQDLRALIWSRAGRRALVAGGCPVNGDGDSAEIFILNLFSELCLANFAGSSCLFCGLCIQKAIIFLKVWYCYCLRMLVLKTWSLYSFRLLQLISNNANAIQPVIFFSKKSCSSPIKSGKRAIASMQKVVVLVYMVIFKTPPTSSEPILVYVNVTTFSNEPRFKKSPVS